MTDSKKLGDTIAGLERDVFGAAECINTQAAALFLTDDTAWKMKRPVDLGFLDFSTVGKRKEALTAELRLNRRTAPDLYRAIHPVTRASDGTLAIDGEGETIDWLLEMRRFPDECLLSRYAEETGIGDPLAIALADRIRAFHAAADVAGDADGAGRLRDVVDGNAERLSALSAILAPEITDALVDRQRALIDSFADLLDARAGDGRVRRGHGDLHAENIVVLGGTPTLFDCLEFDERLATVDVLYDLAFLLMDLWQRGMAGAASRIFNRYLDYSLGDEAGAVLMPLFLSIRATVRAHVHATEAEDGEQGAAERANAYLSLAADTIASAPAMLVAIGGRSGTGKSTVARAIAHGVGAPPGARILRSDILRKRIANVAPDVTLPASAYDRDRSRETYARLRTEAASHLDSALSVIADATFFDAGERGEIATVARHRKCRFTGLWLETTLDTRLSRISGRNFDASDADVSVARTQSDEDSGPLGGWHCLDANGSVTATADTALGLMQCSQGSRC